MDLGSVFQFAPFMLMVAVGVGILGFKFWQRSAARASWASVAERLGLAFDSSPSLTGSYRGRRVEVSTVYRGSGKSRHICTQVETTLAPYLNLGLKIYRQGLLQELGKLVGTQDIETGDAAFDAQFMIKGDDPDKVLRLLDADTRSALAAYDQHFRLNLDDMHISFEERGLITDERRLESVIREQARVCEILSRSFSNLSTSLY